MDAISLAPDFSLHVRSKPVSPLVASIDLASFAAALGATSSSVGMAYRGAPCKIANGYAFRMDGFTVYGTAVNGIVESIALEQYSEKGANTQLIERLNALARRWDLDLVDWCRCARVDPDNALFASLLTNTAT